MKAKGQVEDGWQERLGQALEQIRGVHAAQVVFDRGGDIAEVHLVGSSTRRPKQIVRDAESLILARFGITIDYRKISIVQLDGDAVSSYRNRLRLVTAQPHPIRDDAVQVVLESNAIRFEGAAHVDASDRCGTARAAAQATLDAICQAIDHVIPLSVQEIRVLRPGERGICVALVSAQTPHGYEELSGSCVVVTCLIEAGCKATLDALNRRLPVWIDEVQNQGSSPARAEA